MRRPRGPRSSNRTTRTPGDDRERRDNTGAEGTKGKQPAQESLKSRMQARLRTQKNYLPAPSASEAFSSKKKVPELSRYRDERKRAKTRAAFSRIGIAALVAVMLLAAVWAVFFSPIFALNMNQVKVAVSDSSVPADTIRAQVRTFEGIPITRLSTTTVAQKVEEINRVKQVTVRRAGIHGLTVNVQTRKPAVAVAQGEAWLVLDTDGVQIDAVKDPPKNLPRAQVDAGSKQERRAAIDLITSVQTQLPGELMQRVKVFVASASHLDIQTDDGKTIKWGDSSNSKTKAQVALVLMKQRPAETYDVSAPSRPVTS
ncbi:cell division protein FtsQ/DivIB [Gleimia hominis]|uniref:cell division protein FtsQ/DivIB n=1 Tax=Gleimia hominis TaxID=595468 RepID=UPI000C8070F3|nr:FtsQ-type POTRA domain-containing protein [Gleimia hominis]WIK65235.1 FtsQ-type POTRA domain-containing protein [Gleimia hominis]